MGDNLFEYLPILVFVLFAFGFSGSLVLLTYLRAPRNPTPQKNSAYECGFDAFDDARMPFDVRYGLVAILFIVFDLEIIFLFPWAIYLGDLGWTGFWGMMVFLLILILGFMYEWKKGALEWK